MDTAVVGREADLDAIEEWLREPSPVLLIEGEAGIGKTTLWLSGREAASARGYQMLACTAVQAEAQLSFTAIRDLVDSVYDEFVADLPAPQRHTLDVVLLREAPSGVPPDYGAIGISLLTIFRALGARAPTLVAIDDIQWLDPGSASALAYVLRRLTHDDRAAIFVARRTNEVAAERPLGIDQLNPELVQIVRADGVSMGELAQILRSHGGIAYEHTVLHRLHDASGGNPFIALELARALGPSPAPLAPGEQLPVPETWHALVEGRLAAMPSATFDALLVAAALARPTLELIGRALECDSAVRLAPAAEAQLVVLDGTNVRFAHPLFASAVYDLARPKVRRQIHKRLAQVVIDPEERVRHLALGADEPSEEIARELDQAAQLAASRGAPSAAAELAELAAQLTPNAERERLLERRADAARYHLTGGELGPAAAILEELVEELPPGGMRADALMQLADATQERGHERALQLLTRALDEAQSDEGRIAKIEDLLSTRCHAAGLYDEAQQHARLALKAAERVGDERIVALTLAGIAARETVSALEPTPGLLERAVALEDAGLALPAYPSPSRRLGLRLMCEGRLDEARDRLTHVLARVAGAGAEPFRALVLVDLTVLECRAGRWQLAKQQAADALDVAEQYGFEELVSTPLYANALVDAHLGHIEHARAAAERGIALADEYSRLLHLGLLGFLELSRGDAATADRILRPLAVEFASSMWREPSLAGELPNGIEALVQLGELDEARRLLAALEDRISRIESPWGVASAARCRALILAAEGELESALTAFEQALRVHERLPQPFDHGRTLLAQGATQRRARQRRAARETLEQALAIFDELGALLWAEKTRAELARIGGRAPASDGLTPAERRVAELVAEGRSNKQVAAELVVSVRTVESTLTSIFRKLDVGSRTEMARKLAEPD